MIPPNVVDELAPLPPLEEKRLPSGMDLDDVMILFLRVVGKDYPILQHLGDYGFTLETLRMFLSVFAGQRIEVPNRRVVGRAWESLQLFLAVSSRMATKNEEYDEACSRVASRFSLPRRRVTKAYDMFVDSWENDEPIAE